MTNQTDFALEVEDLIRRHLERDEYSASYMTEELFTAAVALAIAAGGVCWPKNLPESQSLVNALVESIARHSDGWYRGETTSPPGTTLQ